MTAVLCALLAWRGWVQLQAAASRSPRLPRGYTTGLVTANVVLALVCIGVAVGIGVLFYSVCRRSETAANLGYSVTLMLPVGLFGYQGVNSLMNGPGARPAAQSAGSVPSIAGTPAPMAAAPRSTTPGEEQRPSAPPRTSSPSPTAPQTTTQPGTNPPIASRPTVATEDPKIEEALSILIAEIDADAVRVAQALEPAFADWAKSPKRDMRVLDARKAEATELKSESTRLATRLRDARTEAQNRLVEAGIDRSVAQSAAIRFSASGGTMWRAAGCDSVVRACDKVIEECDVLKQGFSKWSIDATGEITSKDFSFKGRARGLRSSVEFSVKDADRLRKQIQGER